MEKEVGPVRRIIILTGVLVALLLILLFVVKFDITGRVIEGVFNETLEGSENRFIKTTMFADEEALKPEYELLEDGRIRILDESAVIFGGISLYNREEEDMVITSTSFNCENEFGEELDLKAGYKNIVLGEENFVCRCQDFACELENSSASDLCEFGKLVKIYGQGKTYFNYNFKGFKKQELPAVIICELGVDGNVIEKVEYWFE